MRLLSLSLSLALALCLAPLAAAANESLDPAFSDDGRVQIFSDSSLRAIAALPMPNGDVTVVSELAHAPGTCASGACILLVRFDDAGNELAVRIKDAALDGVRAAAIDHAGRIVVVGEARFNSVRGLDFGVVRFDADLGDDTTFAGDGGTAVDFGGGSNNDDVPTALAIDRDNRIVVAGSSDSAATSSPDFGIVRINENGGLDSDFGLRRVIFEERFFEPAVPGAVALDDSGRIVVGGFATDHATGQTRVALARLTPQGDFDTSFCAPGCNFNPMPDAHEGRRSYFFGSLDGHSDLLTSLDVDAVGNIVVGGVTYANADGRVHAAIARFDADGNQTREHVDASAGDTLFTGVRFADDVGALVLAAGVHGATGSFFVQAFDHALEFVPAYGDCGIDTSAICFDTAGAGTAFNPLDRFASLNVDRRGRPLFAGTVLTDDLTTATLAARMTVDTLADFDEIFASSFDARLAAGADAR